MRQSLDPEQTAALIRLFELGAKPLTIATKTGLTVGAVYRYRAKWQEERLRAAEPGAPPAVTPASGPTEGAAGPLPSPFTASPPPSRDQQDLAALHAMRQRWVAARDHAQQAVEALDALMTLYAEEVAIAE